MELLLKHIFVTSLDNLIYLIYEYQENGTAHKNHKQECKVWLLLFQKRGQKGGQKGNAGNLNDFDLPLLLSLEQKDGFYFIE